MSSSYFQTKSQVALVLVFVVSILSIWVQCILQHIATFLSGCKMGCMIYLTLLGRGG